MFEARHHTDLDSTNLEARRLIESGQISNRTVLYADIQTAGQGSRGRTWLSTQKGNLLASFVIPVPENWKKPHLALYPISLAVKKFIESLLSPESFQTELKWPNDILLERQKVCGCLHELASCSGQQFFIAGIGINIAWHPTQTSSSFPATSLHQYNNTEWPMEDLITDLGHSIETEVKHWEDLGFRLYMKQVMPHFYHLGEPITIHPDRRKEKAVTGIFQGIDLDGALVLKTLAGTEKITTAEIFPNLA